MTGAGILIFIILRLLFSGGVSLSIGAVVWTVLTRGALLVLAFVVFANEGPAWLAWTLVLCTFPSPLIQGVIVPLGVPWLAFIVTRVLRPGRLGPENAAGAVFNELRARLRWGLLLGPEHLQALARHLRSNSNRPAARGASVAARALLEALKGDREAARALFDLGQELKQSTSEARRFCQAWLLTDAAARADYPELLRLCRRGPRSARRWFLRACVEQMLGVKARSPLTLKGLWLLAPGRIASRQMLRQALGASQALRPTQIPPGLPAARDAAARLALAPAGGVTRFGINQVARAWQAVFDAGTVRSWLTQRMLALEWTSDAALLQGALEQDITSLLREAWPKAVFDPDGSDWLDGASDDAWLMLRSLDSLQDELLSELSPLVEELPHDAAISDDGVEMHFRRWAEVRFRAQRYLDLFPDRSRTLYDSFGTELLNHGSWLHNYEQAYALSSDVFDWLLKVVDPDHPHAGLLTGNRKASVNGARRQ